MYEYIKDNTILIVPNTLKENIIKYIRKEKKDINIKIYNLEEFIKCLTYDYDEKTIYNLMIQESINYDIAKLYLNNICYVKELSNVDKLNRLYNIKTNIDKYLIKDNLFNLLIKNKEIIVYGYDYINKYQRYILDSVENIRFINKEYNNYTHDVYKFNTLEDEIIFVAENICDLINSGINIYDIYLANVDSN